MILKKVQNVYQHRRLEYNVSKTNKVKIKEGKYRKYMQKYKEYIRIKY